MDDTPTVSDNGKGADAKWPSGIEQEPPLGAHVTTSRRGYAQSWHVRRARSRSALLGPVRVLAMRPGRGAVGVSICRRSSGADRQSRPVTVFARRDRTTRSLAHRRERLSLAGYRLDLIAAISAASRLEDDVPFQGADPTTGQLRGVLPFIATSANSGSNHIAAAS